MLKTEIFTFFNPKCTKSQLIHKIANFQKQKLNTDKMYISIPFKKHTTHENINGTA